MPKLKECPVFQWVQQPYASPLNLKLEDRKRIADLSLPILETHRDFFLNSENLIRILQQPRAETPSILQAQRWFEYMNKIRGFSLGDSEALVRNSLS